ncbi:MAG TPA: efflux RND transporter periplasmic adaptor subunit [Tepidisphaeraceae bacterium]|nr:efflux RND transporter periplasmic adaptor subunit [Tepidisphaeraceae bacterium]
MESHYSKTRRSRYKMGSVRWRGLLALALPLFIGFGCERSSAKSPEPAAGKQDKAADSHKEGGGDDHEGHAHGGDEHTDEVVLTPQAIRSHGIKVSRAKPRKLTAVIIAPGRVAYNAEKVAHVGSAVTGRVAQLKVRIGDVVQTGDTLLIIDSPELGEAQSDYLQKRTAVEIAKPAVDLAKSSFERAQQLYDKDQGIALTEVQKRQGEFQAAKGNLQSATAALTAAENRLHLLGVKQDAIESLARTGEIDPQYIVRAPIGGRVIEREATLGELVGPDKERLLMLADLNPIWVSADIPETNISQVSVGSKVEITVPAIAVESFEGIVSYVAPELDPSTRTARVRVEVPNDGTRLLPGMFATASIAVGGSAAEEAILAVPEEAIQTVEGEPSVFVPVANEANTFTKRVVAIGQSISGFVPIYAGLKEGESFVASGSFILKAELGKAGAAHEH